jgi:hypothetical protein
MALRNNGFHIEDESDDRWLAADATAAPGRCFVAYADGGSHQAIVATSLSQVGHAFAEEGGIIATTPPLPPGAVAAFSIDASALHAAVRRIFELSRSLPTAPLDRFAERIRALGSTEAERLVAQRVGQDIFRDALMDLWSKRCAVTSIDQSELLRASHMKPWAVCLNDADRLNPYNGLLLAAHWDAAFDRGLVTFEDDGALKLSPSLSDGARQLLVPSPSSPPRIANLRPAHLPFLAYHRKHVWLA